MSDAKIAIKVQVLLSGRAPHYRRLVAATFSDVREAIARMYHRDAGDLIFEYRDDEGDLVQFDTEFEWEALVTQQQQQHHHQTGALSAPAPAAGAVVRIVVRSTDMEGPALLAAQQALASMSSVAPSMSTFFDAADLSGVAPSLSGHPTISAPQAPAAPSRTPSVVLEAAPSPLSVPPPATSVAEAQPPAPSGFVKRCPMCQSQLQLHASPSWRCDLCSHRASRDGTETSLACRRCDFDLCLDCNNRLDAAAASGDASVPPPPLVAGAIRQWPRGPVGALLHTVHDLVVGAHAHRRGAGGRDDSSAGAQDDTPVLPVLDAAAQPAAPAPSRDATTQGATPVTADATTQGGVTVTADATTQGATPVTADATTQGSTPLTVDATTQGAAPATADATTQGATAATADATTQRAGSAAPPAVTHAETTMTADATTVTTVEPSVTADSATETGDRLVTPPTPEPQSTTSDAEALQAAAASAAAHGTHLTLSPTLRTALRDLVPLLSLVYNIDAERALTTCDAGRFRGAVRIQCNRAAGTVAYTLQDDQFVEHAFARMVELVRLAAAPTATAATPAQPMASASESMEAAVLAASSAVPVPAHPLAAAEEIASGLCSFYPALPAAHYNHAIILVKRNNLPQALTELEAAVDLGISPAVAHSDADLALLHREVRFRLLGAAPADRTPEVKTLLELFGDLSAADARAALARYGSVHRAADALLASDGVLSPEPAAPQAVGLGPYQGPLHGQHHAPPPPPPRPNGPGFYSLSGFPGFGNRR